MKKTLHTILLAVLVIFAMLPLAACGDTDKKDISGASITLTVQKSQLGQSEITDPCCRLMIDSNEIDNANFNIAVTSTADELSVTLTAKGKKYKGTFTKTFDIKANVLREYYLTNLTTDYFVIKQQQNILKVVEETTYDLTTLLTLVNKNDKIFIGRDILKPTDITQKAYIINVPVSIIGQEKTSGKFKVEGIFRINLTSMIETTPVKIENLEISFSGKIGPTPTSPATDERRGILILNGGAEIINNYIHLEDESVTDLPNAPSGIQISVNPNNEVKEELPYVITGNRIGALGWGQVATVNSTSGILIVYDKDEEVNIDYAQINSIYMDNTFDEGCEACINAFDYEIGKYVGGFYKSKDIAKTYIGADLEDIDENMVLVRYNNTDIVYLAYKA